MTLHLIRHAKAASRNAWTEEDVSRPLTKRGREQAAGIAERFGSDGPGSIPLPVRVVSSPATRCVQTVEPLAGRAGVEVEIDDRLAESAWPGDVLALLDELPDDSVCCSHGDVIPEVMATLERRGTTIVSAPDWRKASTWEIARSDGSYTNATVRPPP